MGAVIKRELNNYFRTPLGYIIMGLFLLVTGLFFALMNLFGRNPDFGQFLQSVWIVYLFAVPLLTMRLISEERNQQTDQLLFTSPIRLVDVVGGKFIAAFVVFLLTLVVTALYAVIIAVYGELAFWETLGAYIGFILLGGCFISIGVLVSALTENQVTAAFFTFFVLLFIWLLDVVKQYVPADPGFGIAFAYVIAVGIGALIFLNTRSWLIGVAVAVLGGIAVTVGVIVDTGIYQGLITDVLNWFSLLERFNDFVLGVLKLDVVVFYLSFIGVFLYLTVRILEKRRWA
jgi:ABC-2 type transport system permease protein